MMTTAEKVKNGLIFLAIAGMGTLSVPVHALDWRATPHYGTVDLSAGFRPDPHVTTLVAGGSQTASGEVSCPGRYAEKPDLDLNYQADSYKLTIYAEAAEDLTLVVYDAAGRWHCNDDFSADSNGNPALIWSDPPSGNYNIWVGTYSGETVENARLSISEGDPEWSGVSKTGSRGTSVAIEWGDNTSQWANDGECDDPRFEGPGAHGTNVDADRFHDANDCRRLYEQGQIYLK